MIDYIMATRNKLPWLKICLPFIVNQLQENESIFVQDGASTDGTVEYLQSFGNKIKFDSSPDTCEGHAFNKGILATNGEYIKLISDDDIFDLRIFREMASLMKSENVGAYFCNGLTTQWTDINGIHEMIYVSEYEAYIKLGTPFGFCGCGLIMKRSAISEVGLMMTGIVPMDHEYALRITSSSVKIGFLNKFGYFHVLCEKSNSKSMGEEMRSDISAINVFYNAMAHKKIYGGKDNIPNEIVYNKAMGLMSKER